MEIMRPRINYRQVMRLVQSGMCGWVFVVCSSVVCKLYMYVCINDIYICIYHISNCERELTRL